MFKKTLLVIALSSCVVTGYAAEAKTPSIISSDSAACQQAITPQVSKGLIDKLMKALPQNETDNIFSAVKKSGAEKINKERTKGVNTPVSVSIYSTAESVWTSILDEVIETVQDAIDTMLTTLYENAINKAVSAVNSATSKALGQVAGKLGDQAGPVIVSALGNIVPNVSATLGNCAKNFTADCLSQVESALNKSVAQGLENGVSTAQDQVYNAAHSELSSIYSDVYGKAVDIDSSLGGVVSGTYYDTKSAITKVIYSSSGGRYSASDILSSIGAESMVTVYGQGK